ncbi:MAG: hypothetical protein HKN93_08800 [Acidimicrobiia bacterium]|nr:hypothetical protein [Acidimicrobiia bacterium]
MELVEIRRYPTRPQAEYAKDCLDASGIAASIQGDDAGGANPETSPLVVLVNADQAEAARRILTEPTDW